MLLTVLFGAVLGLIAFGLTRPADLRRMIGAAVLGALAGLVAAYFNVYPGSVRAALSLLAVALFASNMRFGGRFVPSEPLIPRLQWVAGAIIILLLATSLFPYTQAGAKSVSNPLYEDLNNNIVTDAAPALPSAADVRVVTWDLAANIVQRGYANDTSFLDTTDPVVLRHTYPDTVNGEFIWVHAPTPEISKWLFGGRTADKVIYVKNNATDLDPRVVPGTLSVHVDGRFWQDRVQRYAEDHGEFRYALQDVALQLDDDYHPYWIAYLSRIDIRNQPHLEKLILVDAYTGEEQTFAPEEAPAWIEQVYPESYVYYWAQYWGTYREGIMYRWFDAKVLTEPDDVTVRYILLGGQNYWLLPMKQLNGAVLGGYILVNTRTGDATYFDRASQSLVDYTTAYNQLQAIMASGEATGGQGQIRLTISEGYLYPIRMRDGSIRDAYVFPLLANLRVANIAIIDAKEYQASGVFASSVERAIQLFANRMGGPLEPDVNETPREPVQLELREGTVSDGRALVNLNGSFFAVTRDDLAEGDRLEPQREFDELVLAIARVDRGESVTLRVLVENGRVVDVTLPGIDWGGTG